METNRQFSEQQMSHYYALKDKSFGIKDIAKLDKKLVRPLRYWISLGMISGSDGSSDSDLTTWEKFDFFEFIWILLVTELKDLNFSNEVIKKCASEIFKRKDANHQMLEFEKAVVYALRNRKDSFIVFDKQGEFKLYNKENFTRIGEEFSICIVIRIVTLINTFLATKDFIKYITEKRLISETEVLVLNSFYNNPATEATIKFPDNSEIKIKGAGFGKAFIKSIFVPEYRKLFIELNNK